MKNRVYPIVVTAIVGAAYAALTMLLAPISYGMVQLRVSEVLCILPYFMPCTAWGLFAGCAIANILTGNIIDVIFGSLATLAAAICTALCARASRKRPGDIAACAMPVIFNAIVIGVVITCAYNGLTLKDHPGVFAMNAGCVGLGEAVVMFVMGYPLVRYLPKSKYFREFVDKVNSYRIRREK